MASPSPSSPSTNDDDLRAEAIKRIKRKRDFVGHVIFFLIVNVGLWASWMLSGANTHSLWPAWVTGIWLLILVIDAFKVYGERPISDQEISAEMLRLRGR